MLDTDLDEYLTEYRLQTPTEPTVHYEGMRMRYLKFKTIKYLYAIIIS